jgi:hypothetical protein
MATKPMRSTAEQLNAAQIIITNTLADPEIQIAVACYGYSAAKMQEGKTLYEEAVAAVNAQTACAGAQRTVTAQLQTAEQDARDAYQALAQVARAVFGNDRARLTILELNGAMPRTTANFLASAHALFDNALKSEEIKNALAGYGYDAAKVQTERAKIDVFESATQRRESTKGSAQQATIDQTAALQAVKEWVRQYLKIAKVALRGNRALLGKLGLTVRLGKTPAQRTAPQRAAATRKKNREIQQKAA